MRRYIHIITLLLSIAMTACTNDLVDIDTAVGDNEVWAQLRFSHHNFDPIDISTRATLNESAESRVENLFVYIFDGNGNRLESHFYDYNNRVEEFSSVAGHYWRVDNRRNNYQQDTKGSVMIKSPTITNGSIYVIANLNADQLNISAEQLNMVSSLSQLQDLTISMNQEITSRTGLFLMSGFAEGISITDKGNITKNGVSVEISMVRLDAKVTVNVSVSDVNVSGQEMKAFLPESWQVMRLPKGTYLLPMTENNKIKDVDELGYFDSTEQYFESNSNDVSSFSFYMLENMEDTQGLTSYNQRDLRSKKNDGSYDTSNGLWENASEDATYLILKGKVQMTVDSDVATGIQYLEADVTYYVHLGNFGNSRSGGDVNNFTIKRNTHYTYNITIKGVNSIETEVETEVENQSGAVGDVYKSTEEIYTFDAHYGQRVFRIDAEAVRDDIITWYVKTPFSEGMPSIEGGNTQIPHLDYKWVWFMVNKTEYNGVYSRANRMYPGDQNKQLNIGDEGKLMDVVEFSKFLRDEKIKWQNAESDEKATASVFRKDNSGVYCLYVTVFVDEYYYEENPLNSQNKPKDLWKLFVNKPNRLMHIMCDRKVSNDGESSSSGSAITIRQRSIQTPYNLENPNLMDAWGCEMEDEFSDSQLFFYNTSESMTSAAGGALTNIGVVSQKNGLYNTARLWGLVSDQNVYQNIRWDKYIDYERPNNYSTTINGQKITIYFMKDDYVSLRYTTFMRNRDNNGNGIIDPEELRWYVASINQLYDIYMGELGMNSMAALHSPEIAARPNYTSGPYSGAKGWRNHVISSTWSNGQPIVLWAEEGISVSPYATRHNKPAPYSIRCVRNLGLATPTSSTIVKEGQAGSEYPTELIKVTKTSDGIYKFDMSNINDMSVRYYTSRELEMGDEKAETSKVYYGFETGPVIHYPTVDQGGVNNNNNFSVLKEALESGKIICPEGYRIPNVREGALMSLYCDENWWNNSGYILVNTWYSNGDWGNGYDKGYSSWQFNYRFATIGQSGCTAIRVVRDWNPE